MARFFFHIRDGAAVIPDDEGMEFHIVDQAKREGLASVADLLRDAARGSNRLRADQLIGADANGNDVATFAVPTLDQ